MRNSIKFIFSFIFLFSQITFAQSTGKNIEFNSVTGADYFTNYVVSPSAKKNASSTTTSSATVTQDTTNKIDNVASYSVDTSANAGYVEFTLGTVYDPATSGNCEFKGVFKGDGTLYSAQIVDGSGNLLNSAALTNETGWRSFSIIYPCAASGSRKVRITQTTAGTSPAISVGKLYYGQATGIGSGVPNNVFSAKVDATGVVTGENEDWINGNCAVTDTSLFTCTYNTSKFSVQPNCSVSLNEAQLDGGYTARLDSTTSVTAAVVRTGITQTTTNFTKNAKSFTLTCTRAGTDFIQPTITAPNYDTDFGSYTPTVTTSTGTMTNYTATGFWRRIGDSIELTVSLTFSGAAGTWTNPDISLPAGLTIATSKGVSTTSNDALGTASFLDSGVQNYPPGYVVPVSTSTLRVFTSYTGTHTGNAPLLSTQATSTFPFSFGSGDNITIRTFPIPVTGWTTSQRAPQLVGSVTNNQPLAQRIEYASTIRGSDCIASPCGIEYSSNGITNITRSATGSYSVNFNFSYSTFPICMVTNVRGASGHICGIDNNATSVSAAVVVCTNTSAVAVDTRFSILCIGAR
ncbi:MAG: hypothetical protein ACXVCP_00415 [Bdellovibrio sp.]